MAKTNAPSRLAAFFRSPRGVIAGLWASFFTYWAAAACYVPYVSMYYESIGLTGAQIGQLASIRSMISFISSLTLAFLSDFFRQRKRVMVICIIGLSIALVIFPYALSFAALLPVVMLYSIFLSPTNAILDENTLRALDDPRDYSRVRIGGSVGWGILAFLTGFILDRPGADLALIFTLHLIFLIPLLALILILPEGKEKARAAPAEKARLRDVWDLLRLPYYAPWLLAIFLWAVPESALINFLPLHIQNLGGGAALVGADIAFTIVGEVIGFTAAKRVQGRIGARRMIAYAFVLRLIWLLIIPFLTRPGLIPPFQILGGISFTLIQSGSVNYFNRRAPRHIGTTAQAIRGAVLLGLGFGIGALVNGALYESLGSVGMFRVMSVVSAVSLAFALLLRASERRWERENA